MKYAHKHDVACGTQIYLNIMSKGQGLELHLKNMRHIQMTLPVEWYVQPFNFPGFFVQKNDLYSFIIMVVADELV